MTAFRVRGGMKNLQNSRTPAIEKYTYVVIVQRLFT